MPAHSRGLSLQTVRPFLKDVFYLDREYGIRNKPGHVPVGSTFRFRTDQCVGPGDSFALGGHHVPVGVTFSTASYRGFDPGTTSCSYTTEMGCGRER